VIDFQYTVVYQLLRISVVVDINNDYKGRNGMVEAAVKDYDEVESFL
jgi:hypothetical protein